MKKVILIVMSFLFLILVGCSKDSKSSSPISSNTSINIFSQGDQELFRNWVGEVTIDFKDCITMKSVITSEILEVEGNVFKSIDDYEIGDKVKTEIKKENGMYVEYDYLNGELDPEIDKAMTLKELLYGKIIFTDEDIKLANKLSDSLGKRLLNVKDSQPNLLTTSQEEIVISRVFINEKTITATYGKEGELYTADITKNNIKIKSLSSNSVESLNKLVEEYYCEYDIYMDETTVSPNSFTEAEKTYFEKWSKLKFKPFWTLKGGSYYKVLPLSIALRISYNYRGFDASFMVIKRDGKFFSSYILSGETLSETEIYSEKLSENLNL